MWSPQRQDRGKSLGLGTCSWRTAGTERVGVRRMLRHTDAGRPRRGLSKRLAFTLRRRQTVASGSRERLRRIPEKPRALGALGNPWTWTVTRIGTWCAGSRCSLHGICFLQRVSVSDPVMAFCPWLPHRSQSLWTALRARAQDLLSERTSS